MNRVKVVKIENDVIEFDNGVQLLSYHSQDCCEYHELTMKDLSLADFEGLEFDLTEEKFFNRIPDFGIELVPVSGHSVKIPGHGYNNGYYSDHLDLILTNNKDFERIYNITECQKIDG